MKYTLTYLLKIFFAFLEGLCYDYTTVHKYSVKDFQKQIYSYVNKWHKSNRYQIKEILIATIQISLFIYMLYNVSIYLAVMCFVLSMSRRNICKVWKI